MGPARRAVELSTLDTQTAQSASSGCERAIIVCRFYSLRLISLRVFIVSSWRWLDLSHAQRDDRHHTAAVRAADWWFGLGSPGVRQHHAQQQLHHLQQLLAVAMQQAVVAGTAEAFGQHMAQQHPQELRAGQALDQYRTAVVADAKGDQAIAIAEDVLLGEHTAVEVATQIHQRLVATADGLAVHHPIPWDRCLHAQTGPAHAVQPFGAEHLGQVGGREEVALLFRPPGSLLASLPPGCCWLVVDGTSRNDQVHVGMEVQAAAVGRVPLRGVNPEARLP